MIAYVVELLIAGAACETAARFEGWGVGMVAIMLPTYLAACDVRYMVTP